MIHNFSNFLLFATDKGSNKKGEIFMIQVFTLSLPFVDFRSQAKISPDGFCICVNFKGLTSYLVMSVKKISLFFQELFSCTDWNEIAKSYLFLLHVHQAFRGKMRCTLNLTSTIENEKDIIS